MNKKGMSNIPLGFIGFFILLLALTALIPVQGGLTNPEETINMLSSSQQSIIEKFNVNSQENIEKHAVVKVTYSFVSFVVYSGFEVAKAAINAAVSNPDLVNAKFVVSLVILALIAPVAIIAFKFLVIIFILVKEFFQSRKEKIQNKKYLNK